MTGLPNRRLLEDRVRQEIERASRLSEPSAVFFVDLDRFKKVNDTMGHGAGDELIRQVAARLVAVVRRQDTVARLGGDEFAILLPGMGEEVTVRLLAERMLESLHQPYLIDGAEVYTSASIGVASYPEHGNTYDELLSRADEAMYRSKDMGRNTFQIFTENPQNTLLGDAELEADLHHALERNELFVLYQPYIDLQTNRVVGVEALVRWRHPVRGVIEPGSFLPQAEESRLIIAIDEYVIREAARQMGRWAAEGVEPLRMSVNVSASDLLHPGFVQTVVGALAEHDVDPGRFEVEITERISPDHEGVMRQTVEELRNHGVRFSIEDFGGGGASVEQVAAFPVSTLKIDRSVRPDPRAGRRARRPRLGHRRDGRAPGARLRGRGGRDIPPEPDPAPTGLHHGPGLLLQPAPLPGRRQPDARGEVARPGAGPCTGERLSKLRARVLPTGNQPVTRGDTAAGRPRSGDGGRGARIDHPPSRHGPAIASIRLRPRARPRSVGDHEAERSRYGGVRRLLREVPREAKVRWPRGRAGQRSPGRPGPVPDLRDQDEQDPGQEGLTPGRGGAHRCATARPPGRAVGRPAPGGGRWHVGAARARGWTNARPRDPRRHRC